MLVKKLKKLKRLKPLTTLTFLTFSLSFSLLPQEVFSASLKEAENFCLKLGVDPVVIYAIANVESPFAKEKSLGTPFFFRINSPVVLRGGRLKRIAPKVYFCYNKENCTKIVQFLIRNGIKNIDLGTFQINYLHQRKFFKDLISRAFDQTEAFKMACQIVKRGLEKAGYTAYGVALYHSSTPYLNRKYALKWWRVYKRLKEEK